MKHLAIVISMTALLLVLPACVGRFQVDQAFEGTVVEAACGECQFGLTGQSCDLAVRIDGKAYFVDGTSIDEHGDAHGDDGLCNAIRSARVTGEVKGDRIAVSAFELLPSEDG